jgi:hypothetical protein
MEAAMKQHAWEEISEEKERWHDYCVHCKFSFSSRNWESVCV